MSDCREQPWDPRLTPLLKRCAGIRDLNAALAVLGWDQQVYMPSGAAEGRARQLETLTVIVHEKSTDPAYGDLIREAAAMEFEPDSDEAVRAALRSTLSAMALKRIRQRLDFYIPRVGRAPGRIAIRDQKSRWGSCSQKGNVNFNWKLIMAPPEALDYVVVHELCHLYEFNHSPRFWALVENQIPDYAVWKKWLKQHAEDLNF